jgi:MFS family permease
MLSVNFSSCSETTLRQKSAFGLAAADQVFTKGRPYRTAPMISLSPIHRVFAGFACYSFAMGNIFPRLADVQSGMGVTTAALGLGLIGAPVGTLISFTFASPYLDKIGYGRLLPWALPLLAALYALAVQAPSPLILFLMLLPVGVVIGCVEIMLNAEADRTEFMVGRRIMNRSHAFWSIGFFSAGLFGAQVASFGISPQLHLALVVPIVGLGSYLALHDYAPSPPRGAEADHKAPLIVAPTWPILVLVVVTIPAMVLEGASMDWSAIYMRDSFGSDKFWQGIAVASFAVLQGLMRFYADGVVERFSPAALARVLFVALGLGCITVVLSPWPILSLIGFAAMGLGTSAIFPLAMSAAAQRNDRPSALNIAALAQFSFMIFLIAPPILGFIAHGWGIRTAYGIALPFVLISLVTAGALGKKH